MRARAIVAIVVDLILGGVLYLIFVIHASLILFSTDRAHGVGVEVPQYKIVTPIAVVMVAVTAWWLLGLRHKGKVGARQLHS